MNENPRPIRWLLCASILLVMFCAPAVAMYEWHGFPLQGNADNAAFAYNGTVANDIVNHGNVYIDCGHGADYASPPNGYAEAFSVPAHTGVKFAYLYTGVWHGTEEYRGKLKVDYTNTSGTYTLSATCTDGAGNLTLKADHTGDPDTNDNVWSASHGVDWIWYDVTDYVDSGANSATGYTYDVESGFDGRIYGFKLVVVYENSSESKIRYWINQGHAALAYATGGHPALDYTHTYFNGDITTGTWDYAMLYCTWLTGDPGDNDSLWFNGNLLDSSCTEYEQGQYLDSRWYVVKNGTIDYLAANGNYANYTRAEDKYVHWVEADLILFENEPKPDLTGHPGPSPAGHELVGVPINGPVLPGHNSTHGYVVCHNYAYTVTITNQGQIASGPCQATLRDNGVIVDTQSVPALAPGQSCQVTFNWHPTTSGSHTLTVTIDSNGAVGESDEGNNIVLIDVFAVAAGVAGDADLVVTVDDIVFLPTEGSNYTTIQFTVTNDGTADANNFDVEVWDTTTTPHTLLCTVTMSVAAKADKKGICVVDIPYGGPYPLQVKLDTTGAVPESDEGNNDATKDLTVIEVMLWDSHHHGDISIYNGEYSGYADVPMFKVTKLVPENTTPWDALNSVATVTPNPGHPGQPFVYGIDGLIGDPEGPVYWYLYFNGRYVPNNDLCGVIEMQDNETAHWDFQRQIYPGEGGPSFTPPCTVQSYVAGDDLYPEPFMHGFPMNLAAANGRSRTVWNTLIVYPDGSADFQSLANEIRTRLVAGGVPGGRISIVNDTAAAAGTAKDTSNLILIGNYMANSLIEEVNASHVALGMPVYFNYTSCEIMEDDDDPATPTTAYDHGAVVEAFDNPWNNGKFTNKEGSMILMASGLNDNDAKDAANMLISQTNELNRFWRVRLTTCGDVNRDTLITGLDATMAFNVMFDVPVASRWAADVNRDTLITGLDATIIFNSMFGGPLNCYTGC